MVKHSKITELSNSECAFQYMLKQRVTIMRTSSNNFNTSIAKCSIKLYGLFQLLLQHFSRSSKIGSQITRTSECKNESPINLIDS